MVLEVQQQFNLEVPEMDYETPTHVLICGRTGTGKSVFLEQLGLAFLAKGWKVIDVWNSLGRMEGCFYSLPSNKWKNYWNGLCKGNSIKAFGRRVYAKNGMNGFSSMALNGINNGLPTHVLLPYTPNIPDQIPDNWDLYTMGFNDITKEDMNILCGEEAGGSKEVVTEYILNQMNDDFTVVDFRSGIEKILRKGNVNFEGMDYDIADGRSKKGLQQMLVALTHSKTTSSMNGAYTLDFKKEIEDNSRITVFLQNYIQSDTLRFFNLHYIIRNIFRLLDSGKAKNKVVILIRELSQLAPSESANPHQKILITLLTNLVQRARGANLFLVCDTQNPKKVNQLISSQCGRRVFFSVNTPDELSYIIQGASSKLDDTDYKRIQDLFTGCCCIVGGNRGKRYIRLFPPIHRHYEPGMDIFDEWKKEGREFKSIVKDKQYIVDDYYESVQRYNETKKEDKFKKEVKKIIQKQDIVRDFTLNIKSKFTSTDIEDKLEVSHPLVFKVLKELLNEDKIEIIGGKRPKIYKVK